MHNLPESLCHSFLERLRLEALEADTRAAAEAAAAAAAKQAAGQVVARYTHQLNNACCSLPVQRRDVESLEADNWLSDTIIQLRVQHILSNMLGEETRNRVCAMDVLFSLCLRQVNF